MPDNIKEPIEDNLTAIPTNDEIIPLEEMTVKQLQDEATRLGGSGIENFTTKKQILALIQNLQEKASNPSVPSSNVAPASVPGIDNKSKDVKAWMSKRGIMMNKLWGQIESGNKARVLIPLEPNEKVGVVQVKMVGQRKEFVHVSGAVWKKTFNGYLWMVPKGVYSEAPDQIAREIEKEQVKTMEASKRFDINRLDPETGRPVLDQLQS
jgi:hypothetical protein